MKCGFHCGLVSGACLLVSLCLTGLYADAQEGGGDSRRWLSRISNTDGIPDEPDKLSVDLGGPGNITGRPMNTGLTVRTLRTTLVVLPDHIGRIRAGSDTNRVVLVFRNGDEMARVALLDPLRLDTMLGSITIGTNALVRVAATDGVTLALKLTDGTCLFGAPHGGPVKRADGTAVPWEDVLYLERGPDATGLTAGLSSGELATGATLDKAFGLSGVFGTLAIPEQTIQKISVLPLQSSSRPLVSVNNLAREMAGAVAVAANGAGTLIDGERRVYSVSSGCAWGPTPTAFTVRLGQVSTLTTIRFLLWDRDRRSHRYTVDVSADGTKWEQLADRSEGWWRSWQTIAFAPRPVKAVRINGLYCSTEAVFRVVEIEAYSHAPEVKRYPAWDSGVADELAVRQQTGDWSRHRRVGGGAW